MSNFFLRAGLVSLFFIFATAAGNLYGDEPGQAAGVVCGSSTVRWPSSGDRKVQEHFPATGDVNNLFVPALDDLQKKLRDVKNIVSVSPITKELVHRSISVTSVKDHKTKIDAIEDQMYLCVTFIRKF